MAWEKIFKDDSNVSSSTRSLYCSLGEDAREEIKTSLGMGFRVWGLRLECCIRGSGGLGFGAVEFRKWGLDVHFREP